MNKHLQELIKWLQMDIDRNHYTLNDVNDAFQTLHIPCQGMKAAARSNSNHGIESKETIYCNCKSPRLVTRSTAFNGQSTIENMYQYCTVCKKEHQ